MRPDRRLSRETRFAAAVVAPEDGRISSDRGGAFVAFHGSRNRAPEPQGGYNVVFQPLKDGNAVGRFFVFADGFAGTVEEPGRAAFRPSGLTMRPDGALYISEDAPGRSWRVTYHGDADAPLAPASTPDDGRRAGTARGHPSRRRTHGAGVTPGAAERHKGANRAGRAHLPRRSRRWHLRRLPRLRCERIAAGSLARDRTMARQRRQPGRSQPYRCRRRAEAEKLRGAMPPRGGAPLSDADVTAVVAYVWALSHSGAAQ